MATSGDEDYNFSLLSLVVAAGTGFVIALLVHTFVVAVNLLDWLKARPLEAYDQVIVSIGISRFLFQSACLFQMFFAIFVKKDFIVFVLKTVQVTSNFINIWLTSFLSIILCLKIFNFHNTFYLRLKGVVSKKAVCFIGGFVLLSIFHGSLHVWLNCVTVSANATQNSTVTLPTSDFRYFIYFIFGSAVPFLVYFTASLAVVFFLCLHMTKMKTSASSSFTFDNYYTALESVACCFLCYMFHIGCNLIVLYFFDSLSIVWVNVIFNIFPALHSVFLIYKTPKLKNVVKLAQVWLLRRFRT